MATVPATAEPGRPRTGARGLAQLQPSDRAIQAVWSGVPAQSNLSLAQLDRLAHEALRPVLHQAPFRIAVFRQATWGGAFVNLGAVDGLGRWLVLHSGRAPRPCRPGDCELVQIGGAPVVPHLPFLHVVGRATFRTGAPFSAYFGAAGGNRRRSCLPTASSPSRDAAVLLLGFAVLASSRLRRDHRAVRRRLTWSGARPWQVLLVAAIEVVGITFVSSLVGPVLLEHVATEVPLATVSR